MTIRSVTFGERWEALVSISAPVAERNRAGSRRELSAGEKVQGRVRRACHCAGGRACQRVVVRRPSVADASRRWASSARDKPAGCSSGSLTSAPDRSGWSRGCVSAQDVTIHLKLASTEKPRPGNARTRRKNRLQRRSSRLITGFAAAPAAVGAERQCRLR